MNITRSVLFIFLSFFSLQGCAQNDPAKTLSLNEFKEKINNDSSEMIILDVRTEGELNGPLSKISGAVHIPVQELADRFDELEKYKNKEIVIICRTQNRSSLAAEFLREKGYNAKFVIGGMQGFYNH
jgi:rhodanese-related sulfurtransferase